MESRDSKDNEDDDDFFDALDHFPSVTDSSPFPTTSSSEITFAGEDSSLQDSSLSSDNEIDDTRNTSSRKKVNYSESSLGSTSNANEEENIEESNDSSSSNVLVFISGLLIKAIGVQFNLFIYSISFPVWFLYHFYTFVVDPFQTIKLGRAYMLRKLFAFLEIVADLVGPLISDRLKQRNSIWQMMFRCGWGLFWSAYVCFVLCSILILALIFSGFFMRYLVEEPIKMKEILNFDYTKHSPEAYMTILPHSNDFYGQNCKGNVEIRRTQSRVIPPHHKLQVTVSLSLPESEYNRNLGVFQVRADFLSINGEILASSSQPCMLQFKSEPIRLLLTFLKIAPLVTGYVSESQTLNIKIRGLTEGNTPTACLRVIIEQRAEFNRGAGIPEIYDAALILESELPLFKQIIWSWRKTIYIWISMTSFMMQLLFMLVCCRPIIFPRTGRRDGSVNTNSMSTSG